MHYLYGDHLGSTSLTLDVNGNVVGQRRYEAYGQGRWSRGEEQTDFGFNSHREESEFGLYDYQARYYSPLLGRFISADLAPTEKRDIVSLERVIKKKEQVKKKKMNYKQKVKKNGRKGMYILILVSQLLWAGMPIQKGAASVENRPRELGQERGEMSRGEEQVITETLRLPGQGNERAYLPLVLRKKEQSVQEPGVQKESEERPDLSDTERLTQTQRVQQGQANNDYGSLYGTGGDSVRWQPPGVQDNDINLYGGQVSYEYPLPVPSGPKGFGPELVLRYSGGLVNQMVGEYQTDGGWVGTGWFLDTGQIYSYEDDVSIFGMSYHQNKQHFLKVIDHGRPAVPGIDKVDRAVQFEVTDKAGTRYYFGEHEGGLYGANIGHLKSTRNGCQWRPDIAKLAKVVDRWGNTMGIEYHKYRNGRRGCGPTNFAVGEAYPKHIWYTKNAAAGDGQAEYRIDFIIGEKGYSTNRGGKYGFNSQVLDRIEIYQIEANQTENLVRRIKFKTSSRRINGNPTKTMTLDRIEVIGADGRTALPETSFSYENHQVGYVDSSEGDPGYRRGGLRPYLKKIRTGYGSEVEYSYTERTWQEPKKGYVLWSRVSQRTVRDQYAQTYQQSYGYLREQIDKPNYDALGTVCDLVRRCFLGYGAVQVSDSLGYMTHYEFFKGNEQIGEEDLRRGYLIERRHYGPAEEGRRKVYEVQKQRWEEEAGEQPFAALKETKHYSCNGVLNEGESEGERDNRCIKKRKSWAYDRYGHRTEQINYKANSDEVHSREKWDYIKHVNKWLFKQTRERVYEGSGTGKNSLVRQVWYSYDGRARYNRPLEGAGRLTGVRQWAGNWGGRERFVERRYWYDGYGNVTEERRYNSYGTEEHYAAQGMRQTRYEYDGQGLYAHTVTNAQGHQHKIKSYDYRWQKALEEEDENGWRVQYSYDSFGRLKQVKQRRCGGREMAVAFEAVYHDRESPYKEEARVTISDCAADQARQQTTKHYFFYDGLGRLIQSHGPADEGNGGWVSYRQYDPLGRLQRESVPQRLGDNGGQYQVGQDWNKVGHTLTSYDPLGRVLRVRMPNGNTSQMEYRKDETGWQLMKVTNARGIPKERVRDVDGHMRVVREYQQEAGEQPYRYAETRYSYDVLGQLTEVTDAAGNQTRIGYNKLGRKIWLEDPDMGRWEYSYDALGNLSKQVDARGVERHYRYDTLNRLKEKWTIFPPSGQRKEYVAFWYDEGGAAANALGRQTRMTDEEGEHKWGYDQRGRVERSYRSVFGTDYEYRYAYDSADRLVETTYPDGEVVRQSYTQRGWPDRLSSSYGHTYVAGASYDHQGRQTRLALGQGDIPDVVKRYYPDTEPIQGGQLAQVWASQGNGINWHYTYDQRGNVTQIEDQSTAGGRERLSYSYDGLDRLREVRQVRVGGLGLLPRRSYSYDQVGNMTRKGSLSLSYTDAAHVHAVTEAGTNRYRYDANGNMIYRDEGDNHRYDQFWRGDNLLERITWSERVHLTLYNYEVRLGYDGEGRRLRKWQQETRLSILSQADTSVETSLSLYPLPGYEVDLRWQGREEQSQGEYWNYKVSNHQLVGQGNVANDQIAFYSQPGRVCQNRDRNECVFEARTIYRDKANNLHEIIIAHGRFWHTQWVNGSIQSGADNGQLLTALARFRGSGGPCAGRRGTDCHFESYARFWLGENLVESLSAGGRFWDFAVTDTGYRVWNQGKPLSGVSWYGAAGGPCHNKRGNSCVFQAREVYVDGQGRQVEVVLADNKRWSWTHQGQTRQVQEKGVELSGIRRYREGVCGQVAWGRCVIATLAYRPNEAGQGELESLVAGKLKRVVQTRAETGGTFWNYVLANQKPWAAGNGTDVSAVTRYANGPCAGKKAEECTFEGRTLYKVGQHNREVIIAQGKRWERQQGQAAMTGTALESIRHYQGSGPCGGQAAGKCKFEAYTILRSANNQFWMESIIAQGKYWNFRLGTGELLSHNDLTTVGWYREAGGPCAGKGRGRCEFQARDIYVDEQGDPHEVVLAEGKKWHWEWVGGLRGTRYVREKGVKLKDIPYYRAGPCWGLAREAACQIEALAFLNQEVESVVTGFNVRAAKWEGTRKYYHFGGQRVAVREGGELHYLYGDHLGSMSMTLDVNGNVVGQRRYDPYGQGRWSRGVEQTDFGFNSQREESEFGLYDYQARYFSPLLGRFISADTIVPDFSNPQSLNRYAYVYNNPLKYIDPSGHDPWWLQEPWYEDPVPNQPKTDSMGIDKQQLRMRLYMSNSVCCERQAIAGTHKERIDQSIKAVTPKEWHDELDEINAFLDEWYPVLEFGLSIAMMTSGGPPSKLSGKGLPASFKSGIENVTTAKGLNPFQAYGQARNQAKIFAGLGDDAVDFVQEIGPMAGRVTGRQSPDGLRGWRIDYDDAKSFHVNWWNRTGGNKRNDWLYGAIKVEGGDLTTYHEILSHFP